MIYYKEFVKNAKKCEYNGHLLKKAYKGNNLVFNGEFVLNFSLNPYQQIFSGASASVDSDGWITASRAGRSGIVLTNPIQSEQINPLLETLNIILSYDTSLVPVGSESGFFAQFCSTINTGLSQGQYLSNIKYGAGLIISAGPPSSGTRDFIINKVDPSYSGILYLHLWYNSSNISYRKTRVNQIYGRYY